MTTIFRLAIVGLDTTGIKISIKNNRIHNQPNSVGQGIIRWFYKDNKEILGNLHKPICLYIMKYQNQECFNELNEYAIQGLINLQNTYKEHQTIVHSLQHYIDLLDQNSYDELTDKEKHYFELYDLWTDDEINLTFILFQQYVTNKQLPTLRALHEILEGKDNKLQQILLK